MSHHSYKTKQIKTNPPVGFVLFLFLLIRTSVHVFIIITNTDKQTSHKF